MLGSTPRLFIFDMGGVVTGTVHCIPSMVERLGLAMEEFMAAADAGPIPGSSEAGPMPGSDGPHPYNRGDLRAIQNGSLSPDEFWDRFEGRCARLFPAKNIRVPRLADGSYEDLWGTYFSPLRDEGTVDVIRSLSGAGFRVVCGTNTLPAHFAVHQAKGDYAIFDAVYTSHLMLLLKPDGGFWRHILRSEGVEPWEAFFVDDLDENVQAARAVGLSAHRFVDAVTLRQDLAARGIALR